MTETGRPRRRRRRLAAAGAVVLAWTALTGPVAADERTDRSRERTLAVLRADLDRAGDRRLGALVQVRDGRSQWSAAVGDGDRRAGRQPRHPGERFRIGSITKTFVATVLLQLQGEGRIDLDDPVERWLPGLVHGNGNDGSRITLRHLLNHTSGLYGYDRDPVLASQLFTEAFLTHRFTTHTPTELVRTALAHPPHFAPGTGRRYSNTNYVLASLVIERVTGRTYATEIRRRIIEPLQLRSTSLPGTRTRIPGPHARGHSRFFGADPGVPLHDVTELNPSSAGAAGEMISSLTDLTRFSRALLGGRLLPRAELAQMLTPTSAALGPVGGLGMSPSRLSCEVTVWGHDGGIHGWSSLLVSTRDGRTSAAFTYNADSTGSFRALAESVFCP
ncbi:serine hydrolase domain-containing protein [Streptomyces sp. NPDC058171]